jgi:copper(I)-binding protein
MSRFFGSRVITRIAPAVALSLALGLAVTACGGASSGIKASGAWARQSSMQASAGAAYVVIENTGSAADALIGASSTVATSTEVHETVEMPAESTGMGGTESPAASMGMGGTESADPMASPAASGGTMMGMRPVARVEIPAGGTLELKPGSYHIMLIGLSKDLVVGEKIEITLKFEKAGEVKVTAEVRAE